MAKTKIIFVPIIIAHRMGYFGHQGQLEQSRKIGTQFSRLEIPADYRYYHLSGSLAETYAIAGVAPQFTISSDKWEAFEPQEAILDRLTQQMKAIYAYPTDGYRIVSPEGKQVGILYCNLPDPVVRFKSNGRIALIIDTTHINRQQSQDKV